MRIDPNNITESINSIAPSMREAMRKDITENIEAGLTVVVIRDPMQGLRVFRMIKDVFPLASNASPSLEFEERLLVSTWRPVSLEFIEATEELRLGFFGEKHKTERELKAEAFIDELLEVSKRHGLALAHEDHEGSFLVMDYNERLAQWLRDASPA